LQLDSYYFICYIVLNGGVHEHANIKVKRQARCM